MGSTRFRQSRTGSNEGEDPPARRPGRPRAGTRSAVAAAALALATAIGIVWAAAAVADDPGEPAAQARKASISVSPAARLDAPPSLSVLTGGKLIPGTGKARNRTAMLGGGDEVLAALTGSLVPVVVESRDGSLVAYSSWRELAAPKPGEPAQGFEQGQAVGIPSVRVYEGATGRHRLIATGAHSPALSLEGRLAFFKADETQVRMNRPYTGHVLVGSPKAGGFDSWTTEPARYFPYAWAGDTLLVYRALPGSEATDLYGFTAPGRGHLIAPEAFVVALSPDGSRLLVTVGRRMVEVVRVADGAIEASMPLDGEGVADEGSDTTPHSLMFSGSWRGDRVVANSDLGLVVLNLAQGIRIESVLATPQFAHGIVEPTFTADNQIVGWAALAATKRQPSADVEPTWQHVLVACDLAAASCQFGAPQPARAWTRWIRNPSR